MRIGIVGAGITGLYLAWKLSENGHNVTVFEKKEKIGKEVCSGLFSKRILDFIPESQKLIENRINYCLIHFPKKTLKINFSKSFLVMSHFELDNLVAKLAEKSGVKIILNSPFSISNTDIFQNFERIIGCDGVNSIVRKSLKLKEPEFRLAIQGFIQENNYSNFVETWPTPPQKFCGGGFIWRIPRGQETEYGIIEKPKETKFLLEEFLKKNNLKLQKVKSALIAQDLILPSHSKITLCGEAAGLTKPWSGGGVIWGLLAADLLLKNFPDFLKYKRAVEKFFSIKILFSKMITRLVYFLGFKIPWLLPKELKIEGDFLI